jgi:hypothetical protein
VIVLFPVVWRAFLHNPLLNGLILGVLLIGIGYNIGRILRLRPEIGWIERFRGAGRGAQLQEPPRLVAPIATALAELRERRGRSGLSAMSMRHLLDSLSARLDESRDIARYQTGLLIFLGLLGTFWGLLESINAIGLVISGLTLGSGDFAALFDDLKIGLARPLDGMGTAFSSSLFGLSGSLIVGFLDLQANQAQNAFYNDLEEWLSGFTQHSQAEGGGEPIPAFTAAPLPTYIQALLQQNAEGVERLQQLVARSEDERGQLAATLLTLSDRLGQLGERLEAGETLLRQVAHGHQDIAQRLGGGREASGEVQLLRERLQHTERQLAVLVEQEARGREQMVRELRQEIRLVARTIAIAAGDPQLVKD